jgi:hypothetical protein
MTMLCVSDPCAPRQNGLDTVERSIITHALLSFSGEETVTRELINIWFRRLLSLEEKTKTISPQHLLISGFSFTLHPGPTDLPSFLPSPFVSLSFDDPLPVQNVQREPAHIYIKDRLLPSDLIIC